MLIIIKNVLINFNNNFNQPKMKRTAVSSSSTSRSNKKTCTDESASDPLLKNGLELQYINQSFKYHGNNVGPSLQLFQIMFLSFIVISVQKNCLVGTKVKLMSNAILNQLRIYRILTS